MLADTQVNRTGLVTRVRGNVDRTITSLTGSSQTLVPIPSSGVPRKRLVFKNGAANAALNLLGGTAAIGGAGCITLEPYEGLALYGEDCLNNAITVIGTVANYFSCYEGF